VNGPRSILVAKDVQVRKGGTLVLDVPSLVIEEGEILSLIGPNGAGKSTLLQTLASLNRLSAGGIFFRGEKISSDHRLFQYRRKLAMVFQEPLLFDTTVFENVASGLKIRGREKPEVAKRVQENLERFGIPHLLNRSARKISGGEAQRVALARALATQPEVLFLDEPFAALDHPSRESLIDDLEQILHQTKMTTIFATHDLLEALRLSDRIAVMNRGRIVQIGPPEEVMNHPADEFVASFVGVETILRGKVIRQGGGTFVASISGREIEALGGAQLSEEVVLGIRPENVILSPSPAKEISSARNVFPGRIVKITSLGPLQKIQLDCGFPLAAFVTHHSLENLSLTEGKEMVASFKATAIHVVRRGEK